MTDGYSTCRNIHKWTLIKFKETDPRPSYALSPPAEHRHLASRFGRMVLMRTIGMKVVTVTRYSIPPELPQQYLFVCSSRCILQLPSKVLDLEKERKSQGTHLWGSQQQKALFQKPLMRTILSLPFLLHSIMRCCASQHAVHVGFFLAGSTTYEFLKKNSDMAPSINGVQVNISSRLERRYTRLRFKIIDY